MMLRASGAVLMVLCGWYAGCRTAKRTQRHRAALEQCVLMLGQLAEEISYRGVSLPDLLREWVGRAAYRTLLPRDAASFQELPAPACFSEAEKQLFRACFQGLGHSACGAECSRLLFYRDQFQRCLTQVCAEEVQRRSLYPRLGLCGGMLFAVLFL